MHGEAVDLHAVDLTTGKGPAQRVDADVLRLEVASGLVDLAVKARHLDLAALAGSGAQRCILPEQTENVQAVGNQLLERHPVTSPCSVWRWRRAGYEALSRRLRRRCKTRDLVQVANRTNPCRRHGKRLSSVR